MRAVVNPAFDPARVSPPRGDALSFHRRLPGYAPTPLRPLDGVAEELGLGAVVVKDESNRLGLPSFKVLGASWAVERALREQPEARMLVAASAGNHGRAVAHVASLRGLACRIFVPARSLVVRREAIAAEGAEVIVVDGSYEDAVAEAERCAADPRVVVLADVGAGGPPEWVIDGYQTLFAEAAGQATYDVMLVPVGVGSLAAAAARHGAQSGARVVGVEPVTAGCLTTSLACGAPARVSTPGTAMAGLDCAELSPAAWPTLRSGIAGAVTVTDDESVAAMQLLAAAGLAIGESGAAPLAGLVALNTDGRCSELRTQLELGPRTSVLLVASEGLTGATPAHDEGARPLSFDAPG